MPKRKRFDFFYDDQTRVPDETIRYLEVNHLILLEYILWVRSFEEKDFMDYEELYEQMEKRTKRWLPLYILDRKTFSVDVYTLIIKRKIRTKLLEDGNKTVYYMDPDRKKRYDEFVQDPESLQHSVNSDISWCYMYLADLQKNLFMN